MSRKILILFLPLILIPALVRSEKVTYNRLLESSSVVHYYLPFQNAPELIKYDDTKLYSVYGAGAQSIAAEFINFLFPISGKEKRVEFLPYQYWGQKKPQYKKFDWKTYESRHFNFYHYGDEELLAPLVRIFETHHEHNSRLYGVDNRIKRKIPIILYKTRADFSQTHTLPDLIPETLGGFTEVMSWKRLLFPFEGDKTTFEHVARHEGNHIYHVAKNPKFLPLWFIEGTSEMNSIIWDANAESVIRDAYFSNLLFHIEDLWRVRGTWLMYKEGNYIANYIKENYGEEAIRKLFNNARRYRFKKNVEISLGIKLKELDERIFAHLNAKYGKIAKRRDEVDTSKQVAEGKLLAARGDYFITGSYKESKFSLYLNYVDIKRGLITKRIVSDFEWRNESLHTLKSRVDISDTRLIYPIQSDGFDEIRIQHYFYDEDKGSLSFGPVKKLSFEGISPIYDPIFLDGDRIAFIGYKKGYSNIYFYDLKTTKLEAITNDMDYYRGLDYSAERNIIVFTKEEEQIPKPCRYNYNLYSYDLSTKVFERLTETEYSDLDPEISPDGSKIAFVGDKDDIYNIFFYDLDNKKIVQATDVKVAALSPRWRDNEKLYFGSVKAFSPVVHKLKVPTLKIAFSKSLPEPREEFYRMEGDSLVVGRDIKPQKIDAEIKFKEKFFIKNDKLYIIEKDRSYEVKSFAAHGSSFVMLTEPEELLEWEDEKTEIVFTYEGGQLNRISRSYGFTGNLDSTVLNIVNEFKHDRSIIDMWASPDGGSIFILVNNVLSFEKQKGQQSLYLIDVGSARIDKIPYYSGFAKLKQRITGIYFLQGDKSLIKVNKRSWDWDEYSEFYLLDHKRKKIRKFAYNPRILKISSDAKLVLTLPEKTFSGGNIQIYDSLHDSERIAYEPKGSFEVVNAHFIDGNNLYIGLRNSKDSRVGIIYLDIEDNAIFEKYLKLTAGYFFSNTLSSMLGDRVALKIKDTRTKTGIEKLYHYERESDVLKEIGVNLSYYSRILFSRDLLIFEGKDLDDFNYLCAYKNGKVIKGYKIDSSGYSKSAKRLIISGGDDILSVDLRSGKVDKIIDKAFGFDVYKNTLVLSSFVEGFYNLFAYDLSTDTLKRLSKSWYNELSPKISDEGLAYTVDEEKRFSIHVRPDIGKEKVNRIFYEGSDLFNPVWIDDELYFNAREIKPPEDMIEVKESPRTDYWSEKRLTIPLKIGKISRVIKPQYVYGGIAYDGSTPLIFLSMTADNILSDRGVFINTIYRSDFTNSTIGYTNLEMGRTYTLYLNILDDNTNGGLSFQKKYVIDRFREFDLFSRLEYQAFIPDEFNGDVVEFPGEKTKQFVIKSGGVYAYDTSIWDFHGPSRGAKLFGKAEFGINLKTGKVSNVDVNIDLRLYNSIARRVGFAHRLMGGISQGDYPTIYFLGGNISFRGVPFDGLEGNNYWVFSEDLRIPLFDFIGAFLPDPVDSAIGPFFKFFDVRGGLYLDIGQVWFNKKDDLDEILYSFGFFVNSPTIFGLTLRFSKGLVGESGFNFWFGYNW